MKTEQCSGGGLAWQEDSSWSRDWVVGEAHPPLIPALLSTGGSELKRQPGLQSEFQDGHGYKATYRFKKHFKKKKERKKKLGKFGGFETAERSPSSELPAKAFASNPARVPVQLIA